MARSAPPKTQSMVLLFYPELGHSMWVDHSSGHRTYETLVAYLRRGVRKGEWVAWRTMQVIEEEMGNVGNEKRRNTNVRP